MKNELRKLTGALSDWVDKLKQAEKEYNFQKKLTDKLDSHQGNFTEITLLEIVLWKTNRYPEISESLLEDINDLRNDYTEQKAKNLLSHLLSLKGFDLPMASTILRFANPSELQIIDQRVYRLISNEKHLRKLYNVEAKINLYFEYIDELKGICKNYNIPFIKADRILYQLDKIVNKEIPINY